MTDLSASSLMPFVPSGSDYAASRRFFADLGFEEVWESDGYAGFQNGDAQFILQKYEVKSFAENFMVRLNVPDLEAWWNAVSQRQLEQTYPSVRLKPPTDFPWGREVHLIDLAGVCWHIGESVSRNRRTVERYMEAFRTGDHAEILSCLTDDVEWEVPGTFHVRGKEAFDREIENDAFVGRPLITITRIVESGDVVVAEGSVRTQRKDGPFLTIPFCDLFEMRRGRIGRLISYLAQPSS